MITQLFLIKKEILKIVLHLRISDIPRLFKLPKIKNEFHQISPKLIKKSEIHKTLAKIKKEHQQNQHF